MKFKKLFKLLIKDIIKSIEKGTITIIVKVSTAIHQLDTSFGDGSIDVQ